MGSDGSFRHSFFHVLFFVFAAGTADRFGPFQSVRKVRYRSDTTRRALIGAILFFAVLLSMQGRRPIRSAERAETQPDGHGENKKKKTQKTIAKRKAKQNGESRQNGGGLPRRPVSGTRDRLRPLQSRAPTW